MAVRVAPNIATALTQDEDNNACRGPLISSNVLPAT